MGNKGSSNILISSIVAVISISATMALFMALFLPATSASTGLTELPVLVQVFGSNNTFILYTLNADSFGYEICSLFDASQGLTNNPGGSHGLFNPGADIDLTTTTDFEDLAAPAADVMEFTDQDRALAADSISSVLFWNGVMGFVFGASLRLILSSDLWRDII